MKHFYVKLSQNKNFVVHLVEFFTYIIQNVSNPICLGTTDEKYLG